MINIWIDKGVVCLEGAPKYVDLKYTDFVMNTEKEKTREKKEKQEEKKKQEEKELGNKEVEILEAKIINGNVFKIGDTIKIEVTYKRNDRDLKDAVLGINLMRNDGTYCYGTSTLLDKCNSWELLDDGKIEITLYNVMLLQGEYNMDIAFADGGATNYHYIRQAVKFQIVNEFAELGICRVEHTWK